MDTHQTYPELNKKISPGPKDDFVSHVDITKAHGGYYSKQEPINIFILKTIVPYLKYFPTHIDYFDFGGGDGILAENIAQFLSAHNFTVNATVVDGNPRYLEKAEKRGLATLLVNLDVDPLPKADLITMRAVNHYNSLEAQKRIFKATFNSLNEQRFFMSSICSGSAASCKLKSDFANISELGRAYEPAQIHSTAVGEYINLLTQSGFVDVNIVGYSPAQKWNTLELWERSNHYQTSLALKNNDEKLFLDIEKRKAKFFNKVELLLNTFIQNELSSDIPNTIEEKFKLIPDTEFPIICAYKQ